FPTRYQEAETTEWMGNLLAAVARRDDDDGSICDARERVREGRGYSTEDASGQVGGRGHNHYVGTEVLPAALDIDLQLELPCTVRLASAGRNHTDAALNRFA